MHALQRSRGFTLIELLVMIALIGVSIGLISFGVGKGLQSAKERQALTQLVQSLRAARVQAIVTGQPAQTRFDLRKARFNGPDHKPHSWPQDMHLQLVTAEGLGAAFEFYPDGGSSGGHLMLSRNDKRWRIDINWLTGSVQLHTLN